jgi:predicted nucleic acid-binding protein
MIRVVLDTNVVVSALLQPQSAPSRAFLMTIAGTMVQLCVSGDVCAEYEEVIQRPKFNRSEAVIEQTLRAIRQNGLWVSPPKRCGSVPIPTMTFSWSVLKRHALTILLSGNLKDFPVKWAQTQIVTPRQFLDAMARIPGE